MAKKPTFPARAAVAETVKYFNKNVMLLAPRLPGHPRHRDRARPGHRRRRKRQRPKPVVANSQRRLKPDNFLKCEILSSATVEVPPPSPQDRVLGADIPTSSATPTIWRAVAFAGASISSSKLLNATLAQMLPLQDLEAFSDTFPTLLLSA